MGDEKKTGEFGDVVGSDNEDKEEKITEVSGGLDTGDNGGEFLNDTIVENMNG